MTVSVSNNIVADRIWLELKRRRMSQVQLGEALGVDQTVVSRTLRGVRPLRFDEVVKIAEILEVPLEQLIFGEGALTPTSAA